MMKCIVYLFIHLNNWCVQTETIDLSDQGSRSERSQKMFRRSDVDKSMHSLIDSDGLPYVGQVVSVSLFNMTFFVVKVD